VAALYVRLRLVTREVHERRLDLPAPIRDARALRTLALLDLEAHPPSAAIDVVTIAADPTPGRVLQYSLLTRALPAAERVSTLLARLAALMGADRVGSPQLVDSYRPGAFEMAPFTAFDARSAAGGPATGPPPDVCPRRDAVSGVMRRFRHPIPARVAVEHDRPVRVTTDRRGFGGGRVESCAGPWRSSGEWWHHRAVEPPAAAASRAEAPARQWVSTHRSGYGVRGAILPDPAAMAHDREAQAEHIYALNFLVRESPASLVRERRADERDAADPWTTRQRTAPAWNWDEWDVALADGAAYRLAHDRDTGRWYVHGVID
jgi:hypothetical protein